jgi:hypothetical protein
MRENLADAVEIATIVAGREIATTAGIAAVLGPVDQAAPEETVADRAQAQVALQALVRREDQARAAKAGPVDPVASAGPISVAMIDVVPTTATALRSRNSRRRTSASSFYPSPRGRRALRAR